MRGIRDGELEEINPPKVLSRGFSLNYYFKLYILRKYNK